MRCVWHWFGVNWTELQQPLHVLISSDNPKSLDEARRLTENLLETIRADSISFRLFSFSHAYRLFVWSDYLELAPQVFCWGGFVSPSVILWCMCRFCVCQFILDVYSTQILVLWCLIMLDPLQSGEPLLDIDDASCQLPWIAYLHLGLVLMVPEYLFLHISWTASCGIGFRLSHLLKRLTAVNIVCIRPASYQAVAQGPPPNYNHVPVPLHMSSSMHPPYAYQQPNSVYPQVGAQNLSAQFQQLGYPSGAPAWSAGPLPSNSGPLPQSTAAPVRNLMDPYTNM